MPKNSGEDLRALRIAQARPQPKAREIMHQDPPLGPRMQPMTSGAPFQADRLKGFGTSRTAATAVRTAASPGGIDPRQQLY